MLRFRAANQALIDKYPILLEVQESVSQEGCSIQQKTDYMTERFFSNFGAIKDFTLKTSLASKSSDVPTCGSYWNQAKLLTCAGLCGASTAGAGAVLCGWACWCWFCDENSEIADVWCAT